MLSMNIRGAVMLKYIKNKKSAMTLAEVLVIFIIMGVIATLILVTAKPSDKSLKYVYYRMYHSLDIALYNSSINMDEELRKDIYDTNNDYINEGNTFVGSDKYFPSKPSQLCKLLLEYINTKGGNNCSSADESVVDINNPDFSIEPHFIASNGSKVWMGKSGDCTDSGICYANNSYKSAKTSTETPIRLAYVFVDLNGDMSPNSPIQRGETLADIVGFAITSDLEVVPLGVPTTDVRYFSASVVYANKASRDSDNLVTSNTMPFLQAKKLAWGDNEATDYPFTMSNPGIGCDSPFFVGYTGEDKCASIPKGVSLDDNSEINDQEQSSDCEEMDACYLEIKDYY